MAKEQQLKFKEYKKAKVANNVFVKKKRTPDRKANPTIDDVYDLLHKIYEEVRK